MSKRFFFLAFLVGFVFLFSFNNLNGGDKMAFTLVSSAFNNGMEIPKEYTCDGKDISPPLAWNASPRGTKSYVLIVEDPDAPGGTFTHWVLYDLPLEATTLSEGVSKEPTLENGAKQGINDFRRVGYGGPCPPRGPAHRYIFTLKALDVSNLNLQPKATKSQVEKAMKGHVLVEAKLVGTYKR